MKVDKIREHQKEIKNIQARRFGNIAFQVSDVGLKVVYQETDGIASAMIDSQVEALRDWLCELYGLPKEIK